MHCSQPGQVRHTKREVRRIAKISGSDFSLRNLQSQVASIIIAAEIRTNMGFKELLRRIFLLDLIKGLKLTFSYQRPSATYTDQYPRQRPPVAERYRGAPRLNNHPETGETLCIACNLCSLACPENLIVVGWERTEDRRKKLSTFTYDLSRCMFCGLCEDACPVDALELTQDFELAQYTREGMIWDRKALEEGPTPARYTR
jgi:NADH-quinone oxidoreductase subunit I